MALTATNLTQLCTGGGNSLWFYRTTEAATAPRVSGYFNDFVDSMNVGDVIFLFSGVGGTEAHGVLIVLSNDGTDVDTCDVNAWTLTNTD